MSHWPFRFLHAADFHLEMPPFGLMEVPDHLADRFLESPFDSARAVFDTALAEEVDFVVLSGNLLKARHTGPRGPLFLLEQFERLAESDIRVYWAGGRVDPPEAWPPSIRLPSNVHLFQVGAPEEIIHRRSDTPLARIVGASRSGDGRFRPRDFSPEEPGLFTIGIANGTADPEMLKSSRIDYWALGSCQSSKTLSTELPMIHYPGSPQGRQPEETGSHGCTLIDVDRARNIRSTRVPTDQIRWYDQQVSVDNQTEHNSLIAQLRSQIESRLESAAGPDLFLSWTISGEGSIINEIRRGRLGGQLLEQLRNEYGSGDPAVWSVSISAISADRFPKHWYEQDTIRGDFLRSMDKLLQDDSCPAGWESAIAGSDDSLVAAMAGSLLPDSQLREDIFREAQLLGTDLLSGEEV